MNHGLRFCAHLKTCDDRYTMPSRIPSGAVPLMSRKLKPPMLDTFPCKGVYEQLQRGAETPVTRWLGRAQGTQE